jgi:hypothetical protein
VRFTIEPGSPSENGYCESFNSKFRDEFLNGELFYSLAEARIIIVGWRQHCNTRRPHSSPVYKPTAPPNECAHDFTAAGYDATDRKGSGVSAAASASRAPTLTHETLDGDGGWTHRSAELDHLRLAKCTIDRCRC